MAQPSPPGAASPTALVASKCATNGPMSEELEVLVLVANRLDDARIPYMLSGSTAMNAYAEPRMTRDIDVVVEIGADDVHRIAAAFADGFYCDRDMIAQAVADQSAFNLIHTPSVIKIDLIVRKDTPYRRLEFDRRRTITVDGHTIWIVSAEDLVLSKLVWAKPSRSEVQLRDVRNLIGCVPTLNWHYLERWAAELDVADLLAETRA